MPKSIHEYQKYLNPSGDPVPLTAHFHIRGQLFHDNRGQHYYTVMFLQLGWFLNDG
jgi:hypothetical protein